MKIVNLTPHTVNIKKQDGSIDSYRPSGKVARIETNQTDNTTITDGSNAKIDVFHTKYGKVTGIPKAEEGVIYLCSTQVEINTKRQDVFSPGPPLRDEEKRVIACHGLKKTVEE